MKLCKTRKLAFSVKMEGVSEKQIYKPLEVFIQLASLFDLYEFGREDWILVLDLDSGQSVIVT